ncbi:unnamed protein product, partial [Musa acuminata subsp. burmannicoides]
MSKKKRAWGRGSVHHRSVGSGSSNEHIRRIKGQVRDEASLSRSRGMRRDRKWEANGIGDVLAKLGASAKLNGVAMCQEEAANSESLVEHSYGKTVEVGGVDDRCGGELDPMGEVAGVGLTRAEDADGSRDSFDVNEQRFSAAGWDAGCGGDGRW